MNDGQTVARTDRVSVSRTMLNYHTLLFKFLTLSVLQSIKTDGRMDGQTPFSYLVHTVILCTDLKR